MGGFLVGRVRLFSFGVCAAGELSMPGTPSVVAVCGQSGLAAALGRDGSITVFRLASSEAITKRPAEAGLAILACSPDGKLLATSKGDETVVIADLSGTALRKFAIYRTAGRRPDLFSGFILACGPALRIADSALGCCPRYADCRPANQLQRQRRRRFLP